MSISSERRNAGWFREIKSLRILTGRDTRHVILAIGTSAKITRWIGLLTAVLALTVMTSCDRLGIVVVKIGDLLAKPQNYSGQEVRIHGTVSDVLKIPLVPTAFYSVNDGSGTVMVITDRGTPLSGSQVRVKGAIDTVASIGGQNIGLHLREIERW